MPDPLQHVREQADLLDLLEQQVASQRQARNEAIGSAFLAGVPIGEIARTARVTPARVSAILGYPWQRPGRPKHPT